MVKLLNFWSAALAIWSCTVFCNSVAALQLTASASHYGESSQVRHAHRFSKSVSHSKRHRGLSVSKSQKHERKSRSLLNANDPASEIFPVVVGAEAAELGYYIAIFFTVWVVFLLGYLDYTHIVGPPEDVANGAEGRYARSLHELWKWEHVHGTPQDPGPGYDEGYHSHGFVWTSISHLLAWPHRDFAIGGFYVIGLLAATMFWIRWYPVNEFGTIIPSNSAMSFYAFFVALGCVLVTSFDVFDDKILHYIGAGLVIFGITFAQAFHSWNMYQRTHGGSKEAYSPFQVELANVARVYSLIAVTASLLTFTAVIFDEIGIPPGCTQGATRAESTCWFWIPKNAVDPTPQSWESSQVKTSSLQFGISNWTTIIMMTFYFSVIMFPWAMEEVQRQAADGIREASKMSTTWYFQHLGSLILVLFVPIIGYVLLDGS